MTNENGHEQFRLTIYAHGAREFDLLQENLKTLVEQHLIDIVPFDSLNEENNKKKLQGEDLMKRAFDKEQLQELIDKAPDDIKADVRKAVEFLLNVDEALAARDAEREQLLKRIGELESLLKQRDSDLSDINDKADKALSRSREFNKKFGIP